MLFLLLFLFGTSTKTQANNDQNLAIAQEEDSTKKNCYLTVVSLYFSKKTEKNHYSFFFSTKEECESLRGIFETNFSPKEVKEKKVEIEWVNK